MFFVELRVEGGPELHAVVDLIGHVAAYVAHARNDKRPLHPRVPSERARLGKRIRRSSIARLFDVRFENGLRRKGPPTRQDGVERLSVEVRHPHLNAEVDRPAREAVQEARDQVPATLQHVRVRRCRNLLS